MDALPWDARRDRLWPVVTHAVAELRATADLVIVEGAGSPAEINLRSRDFVNMAVARETEAPVLVVADIERGGAFAALYGTWALVDDAERRHLRGFLLNRFRGDAALLTSGLAELRERTGVPVLGVIPLLPHLLPEEDAATLGARGAGRVAIAAVCFPNVANVDDLDPLAGEPGVAVRWVEGPEGLQDAAAIVLPGSRNTLADLRWLWETGLGAAVRARAAAGVPVVGLCGGYQMLGREVSDPLGVEAGGSTPGLGLLDLRTTLEGSKQVRLVSVRVVAPDGAFASLRGHTIDGYEIHHGETSIGAGTVVWFESARQPLGAGCGSVWGTYLHGFFADDQARRAWLGALNGECTTPTPAWATRLDAEIDRIADAVAAALDIDTVMQLIEQGVPCA
jgi:adenosylcobyric acid synthase